YRAACQLSTVIRLQGSMLPSALMIRRSFLASLGALSVARSLTSGPPPGLAPADDFGFADGLVYLQTGSLGPTPRPVRERVHAPATQLERTPTLQGYGVLQEAMDGVRATAAAFLGCGKNEMLLTGSTTEGMNWVAQGLTWTAGDRVLTTDQEHPGGRIGWQ